MKQRLLYCMGNMKIYCHICNANKVIKESEFNRSNPKAYCYEHNPSVPSRMSRETKAESDKDFARLRTKLGII